MGGKGGAVLVQHFIDVAVVSGDYCGAVHFHGRFNHAADALVHHLDRFDRGVENAGVAHHVAVGEVQDNHVVFAGCNPIYHLVAYRVGAHLRFQIKGGYVRGRYKHPVLAFEHHFFAAVVKEGYVGVFCGFRNTQLCQARPADRFAHSHGQLDWRERHRDVRHGRVIFGHADIFKREHVLPFKTRKIRVYESACYLPCAIRPEVKENHAVPVFDGFSVLNHCGNHKFVGGVLAFGVEGAVGFLDRLYRVGGPDAFAINHRVIGLLDPPPLGVAVHPVVPAHHGGNFPDADFRDFPLKLTQVSGSGGRRHVPAVKHGVDKNLFHAVILGHFE